MTVLGIDPGTHIAGIAVLRFDKRGTPERLAVKRLIARDTKRKGIGPDTKRFLRMDSLRQQAEHFRWEQPFALDLVAYEDVVFAAGKMSRGATIGIAQAVAVLVAPFAREGLDVIPVPTATAKSAAGVNMMAINKGMAGSANRAKRLKACKDLVICWANETLNLALTGEEEGDDAIADACAVCAGAWRIMAKAEELGG